MGVCSLVQASGILVEQFDKLTAGFIASYIPFEEGCQFIVKNWNVCIYTMCASLSGHILYIALVGCSRFPRWYHNY